MNFKNAIKPFQYLALFYLIINFLLRLVLLFHPITKSNFKGSEVIQIFIFGALSDFFIFLIASLFLWLYLLFLSNSKFNKPWGYLLLFCYVSLLLYVLSGKSILHEYGGILPEIATIFIGSKTILIALLLFLPKYRKNIRLVVFLFTIFLFVLIMVQNAVSEFFFWNEFGVKYNFIAVDYLVYTNTVIGNIIESYPVIPLFTVVVLVAFGTTFYIVKKSKNYLNNLPTFIEKLKILALYIVFFIFSLFAIPQLAKKENSKNVFTNELQSNGIYKFYLAFMNSELDYYKFYTTSKDDVVFNRLSNQIPISGKSSLRTIQSDSIEIKKNIVLITIESLSAEYMEMYGNELKLTPFLDSLALQSMNFSNLYATGNRTVRGLEAVTLSIPPTPGESIVKREDNKNKFSTASVLSQKGYTCKYLYGGDAYFDNMDDFFGGNNYDVIDKSYLSPEEITFSNIWGVCDEDMANKAIEVMNKEYKEGKLFFNHWMTVSNHRPFTFPEGKIDPVFSKTREGGIKYTDYALQQFFKKAKKQPWFNNTVFVIVADHCASSSGKTELPMDKYRIPAMLFAPGFIKPQNVNVLMSQIDLMPTLFGLLNFNYQSKFFGQDVLKDDYKPRSFIATYEDLGYIKNNILTILSPVRKERQFDLKRTPNSKLKQDYQIYYEENEKKNLDEKLINEAQSFYQSAAYLLKNKKYNKLQ